MDLSKLSDDDLRAIYHDRYKDVSEDGKQDIGSQISEQKRVEAENAPPPAPVEPKFENTITGKNINDVVGGLQTAGHYLGPIVSNPYVDTAALAAAAAKPIINRLMPQSPQAPQPQPAPQPRPVSPGGNGNVSPIRPGVEIPGGAAANAERSMFTRGLDYANDMRKLAAEKATQAATALGEASPMLKAAGKIGGKVLPGAGLALNATDAYNRMQQGDYTGAGIAGVGGVAGLFPGVGTAVSLGATALNAKRDYDKYIEAKREFEKNKMAVEEQEKKRILGAKHWKEQEDVK